MKKGILFLAALMSAAMAYGQNPEYLPEWKEGYLDIHTIAFIPSFCAIHATAIP